MMAAEQKTIVCRERGEDCDWEVCDSDERELLESLRAHARRRHALDLTIEQARSRMRPVVQGVGGL